MIQEKEFRELCKEVVEELKTKYPTLTLDSVASMIKDCFGFAEKHISEGSLTPIYFQYLGRFRVKEGRKEWLRKKREEKYANKQPEFPAEGDTSTSS